MVRHVSWEHHHGGESSFLLYDDKHRRLLGVV